MESKRTHTQMSDLVIGNWALRWVCLALLVLAVIYPTATMLESRRASSSCNTTQSIDSNLYYATSVDHHYDTTTTVEQVPAANILAKAANLLFHPYPSQHVVSPTVNHCGSIRPSPQDLGQKDGLNTGSKSFNSLNSDDNPVLENNFLLPVSYRRRRGCTNGLCFTKPSNINHQLEVAPRSEGSVGNLEESIVKLEHSTITVSDDLHEGQTHQCHGCIDARAGPQETNISHNTYTKPPFPRNILPARWETSCRNLTGYALSRCKEDVKMRTSLFGVLASIFGLTVICLLSFAMISCVRRQTGSASAPTWTTKCPYYFNKSSTIRRGTARKLFDREDAVEAEEQGLPSQCITATLDGGLMHRLCPGRVTLVCNLVVSKIVILIFFLATSV